MEGKWKGCEEVGFPAEFINIFGYPGWDCFGNHTVKGTKSSLAVFKAVLVFIFVDAAVVDGCDDDDDNAVDELLVVVWSVVVLPVSLFDELTEGIAVVVELFVFSDVVAVTGAEVHDEGIGNDDWFRWNGKKEFIKEEEGGNIIDALEKNKEGSLPIIIELWKLFIKDE